jgi:signal transduction histidine kinase/CheY-like chemotaxis protein
LGLERLILSNPHANMSTTLLTIEIRYEQDVVLTRQRARQIAQLLGFDAQEQTRIATAVSEIARNAFQYAKGGKVQFWVEAESPSSLLICIRDQGSGIPNLKTILDGQYTSTTGMGIGITGSQQLMDRFDIETTLGQGTTVVMGKTLPKRATRLSAERLGQIADELVMRSPQNPFEEIQQQNQELLRALDELRKREEQLTQLNCELEDTNRGVVALYAELDEKADSLQKANELKTRFLSNMSHEFRTPLNSILSLSRLLLERMDGDLTAEQEKQVTFIRKSAEGLSELVNDLLDLAKVEAGKVEVYSTKFEVSELFGTLRGMLRPLLAHNSSISLVFEEPIGIPTLYTDEGKVAQILRNFISNALKYTEEGEIRVAAVTGGDTVTFSVGDTGIGIASENLDQIFEDFIQIESSLQKKVKGTGLGLPLSRKLTELLGGSVFVTSKIGVGSTFFATIPIVHSKATEARLMLPVNWQLDPSRDPVLVVEDNVETLFTYEKYLNESIYQLIPARSLLQAKETLERVQPIAIILDILLDGHNTWAFLKEMKENPATQTIPILVATVIDNEKQAIALGADAFLIKPVDRLSLLHKLNTLVKQDKQQKILLIDNDLVERYLFKQLLVDTDINIIEAADGREGLRLAGSENPSCIVLDLVMPEMGGIEVLDQIKSNLATRHIPVLVNTSKRLEEEEKRYLADKTIAILSKESPSQDVALASANANLSAKLREALVKAGLILEACGKGNA